MLAQTDGHFQHIMPVHPWLSMQLWLSWLTTRSGRDFSSTIVSAIAPKQQLGLPRERQRS